jgi:hypothetical protein
LLSAVGLLFLTPNAQAQAVTAGPDSVQVQAGPAVPDSVRRTERLLGLRMTRPTKALLLAAVLPGAGQVYNRKYWKLPLVYAALGGTIYGESFYLERYREFRDGYRARQRRAAGQTGPNTIDTGPLSGDEQRFPQNTAGDAAQLRALNFYRTQRDVFFAYIAGAYGLQMLDAVVDAHLYGFDVSDNLSLNWQPALLPTLNGPAAGLALTFTLRPRPFQAPPRRF